MPWVRIRSRRDPAFWLPLAAAVLVAAPLALWGRSCATEYIGHLEAIRGSDPAAARIAAERALRLIAGSTCGALLASAALFARYAWLGLRQRRLPPAGWWSLGAHRAATEGTAERLARLGLALSAVLALAGVGLMFFVLRLLDALAAPA